ncbi:hypothetical protein EWM64_g6902 [Hericium alpestre]|uniref:Uncharacterized protein n=1 Tax=Hericium alpestre TaxID=135208 RepID=A0A4Y9ZS62_9AGAM|nr:hypothetical protein EWM64_g6902 [Hericium alpestre]
MPYNVQRRYELSASSGIEGDEDVHEDAGEDEREDEGEDEREDREDEQEDEQKRTSERTRRRMKKALKLEQSRNTTFGYVVNVEINVREQVGVDGGSRQD